MSARGVLKRAALLVALAAALSPASLAATTRARSPVEGELNRATAALQLGRFDEAAGHFAALAGAGNPVAQL